MKKVSRDSLNWLEFEQFNDDPHITHGVFMRHGGVSPPPFDSLNVGCSTGDSREHLVRNQELIQEALGLPVIARVTQVHGDEVIVVDDNVPGMTAQADALLTNRPGMTLMVQIADCQSVLLYEPQSRVIANIHCGWRGSLLNLIGRTMEQAAVLGAEPSRMIAAVGPSLGPCCAEYRDHEKMFPREWQKYHVGRNYFDFWAITRDQLTAAGVNPGSIEVAGICTKCSTKDFFSYRSQAVTGRFASVIGLR